MFHTMQNSENTENESRGQKIKENAFNFLAKKFIEMFPNADHRFFNEYVKTTNDCLMTQDFMQSWVVQQSGKATRQEKNLSEQCLLQIATSICTLVQQLSVAYEMDNIQCAILQLNVTGGIVTAQFYRKHKSKDAALVKSIFNGITLRQFLTPFGPYFMLLRTAFPDFNWHNDFDMHLDYQDCREWKLPILKIIAHTDSYLKSRKLRNENALLKAQNATLNSQILGYSQEIHELRSELSKLKQMMSMPPLQYSQHDQLNQHNQHHQQQQHHHHQQQQQHQQQLQQHDLQQQLHQQQQPQHQQHQQQSQHQHQSQVSQYSCPSLDNTVMSNPSTPNPQNCNGFYGNFMHSVAHQTQQSQHQLQSQHHIESQTPFSQQAPLQLQLEQHQNETSSLSLSSSNHHDYQQLHNNINTNHHLDVLKGENIINTMTNSSCRSNNSNISSASADSCPTSLAFPTYFGGNNRQYDLTSNFNNENIFSSESRTNNPSDNGSFAPLTATTQLVNDNSSGLNFTWALENTDGRTQASIDTEMSQPVGNLPPQTNQNLW